MKTVLVIDDDATLRDTIGVMLETEGFSPVLAEDGRLPRSGAALQGEGPPRGAVAHPDCEDVGSVPLALRYQVDRGGGIAAGVYLKGFVPGGRDPLQALAIVSRRKHVADFDLHAAAEDFGNLRQAVLFHQGVEKIIDSGCSMLIEVGPHPALTPAVVHVWAVSWARVSDPRLQEPSEFFSCHVRKAAGKRGA